MKKKLLFLFFITFFCSTISQGQDKPLWITSFENKLKQTEIDWKMGETREFQSKNGLYDYVFRLSSGTQRVSIHINKLPDIPNPGKTSPEETFKGIFKEMVTLFDNNLDKNVEKTTLENFGNEGIIWANLNKNIWTTIIKFRKYDIFVAIHSTSEEMARKSAGYVVEQMP
ncbi:MAG TPA: hypothetical protein VK892_10435 [Pyrinomonadaceae bacterium]|nr:hypothetical protein [Pyrinomonadaceae bacterium]